PARRARLREEAEHGARQRHGAAAQAHAGQRVAVLLAHAPSRGGRRNAAAGPRRRTELLLACVTVGELYQMAAPGRGSLRGGPVGPPLARGVAPTAQPNRSTRRFLPRLAGAAAGRASASGGVAGCAWRAGWRPAAPALPLPLRAPRPVRASWPASWRPS